MQRAEAAGHEIKGREVSGWSKAVFTKWKTAHGGFSCQTSTVFWFLAHFQSYFKSSISQRSSSLVDSCMWPWLPLYHLCLLPSALEKTSRTKLSVFFLRFFKQPSPPSFWTVMSQIFLKDCWKSVQTSVATKKCVLWGKCPHIICKNLLSEGGAIFMRKHAALVGQRQCN